VYADTKYGPFGILTVHDVADTEALLEEETKKSSFPYFESVLVNDT
jgi:hypothetical protein